MIISKLQGGLGNQLFQWEAARSYSDVHNCEHKFDTSFYPYQNFRQLELYNFENLTFSTINRFDIGKPIIEINDNYHFQELPYVNDCVVFLNGFWQSEKYFIKSQNIIRKELSPDEETLSRLKRTPLLETNTLSLHIRRTDYVSSNGYHPVQPISYYEEAINIIGDYDFIFVFSDDIEWCMNNLKFKNMIFMGGSTGFSNVEEMWLMSMCKNHIIANSSFSWWGAWLNSNPNKKVVAPLNWFGSHTNINDSDIVPDSWIKI